MPDAAVPRPVGGRRALGDRERVGYYLAALLAVFVLAFFAGRVVGPGLGLDDRPADPDHQRMSEMATLPSPRPSVAGAQGVERG